MSGRRTLGVVCTAAIGDAVASLPLPPSEDEGKEAMNVPHGLRPRAHRFRRGDRLAKRWRIEAVDLRAVEFLQFNRADAGRMCFSISSP